MSGAEERLVLLGARVQLEGHARAEAESIVAAGVDWAPVVERSRVEGTSGLLAANLAAINERRGRVPAGVLAGLSRGLTAQWARNTALTDAWKAAVTDLAAAGVASITHKGMALLHTVYPDPGLRPMADVDLLIRLEDLATARSVLAAAGYQVAGEAEQAEQIFRSYLVLVRGPVVIDLHLALGNYVLLDGILRVDHEGLWRRAQPLVVGEARGLTLSPADHLLHLALHLTVGSEMGRVVWFSDVDALVRGVDLDWAAIVDEARRWRAEKILGYVLSVVGRSFGTPVPAEVLSRLALPRLRRRLVNASVGLVAPPSLSGIGPSRVYLAETLLMDRVRDVLRLFARRLFPSRRWLAGHYETVPRWKLPIYRVLHPARVGYLALRHLR